MSIKKGRILARCLECEEEAVAKGDGSAVSIPHKKGCAEHPDAYADGGQTLEDSEYDPEDFGDGA